MVGVANAGSSLVLGLPMHLGFSHLYKKIIQGQSRTATRECQNDCLHEQAKMRENMFKNAVHLVDLQWNHSEAQLGKEVEMLSMNITGAKSPLRRSFCKFIIMTTLFDFLRGR